MLLGFRMRDQRLRSGETLARPLLLRSATLGWGANLARKTMDAVPFNLCVACPEQKSSRTKPRSFGHSFGVQHDAAHGRAGSFH